MGKYLSAQLLNLASLLPIAGGLHLLRIFLFVALLIFPAMAQAQVDDEGSRLKLYQIVRTSAVDAETHRLPGQKYLVKYKYFADCYGYFREVEEYKLHMVATFGRDSSSVKTIEEKQIWKHDCNEEIELWYEHTVPYPQNINPYFTKPATPITIKVCPENWADVVHCASHNITVRNSLPGGWFVDLRQNSSQNSSSSTLQFVGAAYNYTGRTTSAADKELIFIRTVDRNKLSVNDLIIGRQIVESTEHFGAEEFSFEDTPPRDGTYHYKTCLEGEDTAGWPTSLCSGQVEVVVDKTARTWDPGGLVVIPPDGGFSRTTIANRAFQLSFSVRNRKAQNQPDGSMRFSVRRRNGGDGPFITVNEGELRAIRSRTTINEHFGHEPLPEGLYEFQLCLGEPNLNSFSLCGSWSEITVTTNGQLPPQPDAPDGLGQLDLKCFFGQVYNRGSRTCECPTSDPIWDEATQTCVSLAVSCAAPFLLYSEKNGCVCPKGRSKIGNSCRQNPPLLNCPAEAKKSGNKCVCAGSAKWNSKTNKCVKPAQAQCSRPFVYSKSNSACVCPKGQTKIGNSCRVKPNTTPARLDCPAAAKQSGTKCVCAGAAKWDSKTNKCVKPARIQCNRPFVYSKSNNACVCPKGQSKIGNSCRPKTNAAPVRLNCPSGAKQSGNKCICAKPAKWNSKTNKCVKPTLQQCRKPLVYDKRASKCVCSGGTKWSSSANRCIGGATTAPTCSNPKQLRADGKCCPKNTVARLNRCVRVK